MKVKIKVRDLFKQSLKSSSENLLLLSGVSALYLVVVLTLIPIQMICMQHYLLLTFYNLFNLFFAGVSSVFFFMIALQAAKSQKVVIPGVRRLWKFFLHILLGTVVSIVPFFMGGFLLGFSASTVGAITALPVYLWVVILAVFLIAAYLFIRVQFFAFAVIEHDYSFWRAMVYSWKLTGGNLWLIIRYSIIASLILTVGVLLLFLGIFPAMAIVYIMFAKLYLQMQEGMEQPFADQSGVIEETVSVEETKEEDFLPKGSGSLE